MATVLIDIETRSLLDLPEVGANRYGEHDSTAVMMGAVMDRGPGAVRMLPRMAEMKANNAGNRLPAPANINKARNQVKEQRQAAAREPNRALAAAPVAPGIPVRKNMAQAGRRPGMVGGPMPGQMFNAKIGRAHV